MNYRLLIQNRKSVREFTDRQVTFAQLDEIRNYYRNRVRRLVPEIKTELYFFGSSTAAALEGAAGYNSFLVGSPQYLVLMSESGPLSAINAGYMMEDLILKVTELGLDSCWLTFADSQDVKESLGIESELEVAAIAAFGFGQKGLRRLRLNMRSMSDVDIVAKHRYMEPKRSIRELVHIDTWGNRRNLENRIGFFDDVLWEALYAASLSPSYLNRQAYGFLLHDGGISLVSRPDPFTAGADGQLSLGIVLLHFSTVAEEWTGKLSWRFTAEAGDPQLPEGHKLIATVAM